MDRWRSYLPMLWVGLLSGLVIAAGLWVWQRLHDPQMLPFHEIRISGQFQHLNPGQLKQILQPQIQGGFFSIHLESLRQSLMAHAWVEEVSIRRIPGILYVNVREAKPIARWNDQYLISSKGQFFLAPSDAPTGLPILRGSLGKEMIVFENYKKINILLSKLQLKLQEITLDQRGNWALTLSNGILVTAGRDDVLFRMERLVHWYPQIVNDKASEITHIDLRYSNGVAVQFSSNSR